MNIQHSTSHARGLLLGVSISVGSACEVSQQLGDEGGSGSGASEAGTTDDADASGPSVDGTGTAGSGTAPETTSTGPGDGSAGDTTGDSGAVPECEPVAGPAAFSSCEVGDAVELLDDARWLSVAWNGCEYALLVFTGTNAEECSVDATRFVRVAPDGSLAGEPVDVAIAGGRLHALGGGYVVAQTDIVDINVYGLSLQRLTGAGDLDGAAQPIVGAASSVTSSQGSAGVALAWSEPVLAPPGDGAIGLVALAPDGTQIGPVAPSGVGAHYNGWNTPMAVSWDGEDFHVVRETGDALRYARVGADGTVASDVELQALDSSFAIWSSEPSVIPAADGGAWVAYHSSNAELRPIRLAHLDASGALVSNVAVSDETENTLYPHLVAGAGEIGLSWSQDYGAGPEFLVRLADDGAIGADPVVVDPMLALDGCASAPWLVGMPSGYGAFRVEQNRVRYIPVTCEPG